MEQLAIAIGQLTPKNSPSDPRTPEQMPGSERPAEAMASIPAPGEMPPALPPTVLGRVAEQSEESEFARSDASFRKSNVSRRRSRKSSGDGRASQALDRFLAGRDPQSSQYGMMNELEEHHAFRLIQARRTGRAHSETKKLRTRSRETPAQPVARNDSHSPSPQRRALTITSRAGAEDKEVMLSRVRRVSLEDLRNNYDAVLVSRAKLPTSTWQTEDATALTRVAWCLLCVTGLLTFRDGRFWRLLSWLSFAIIPGCATLALASFSLTVGADVSVVVTLCCFAFGVLMATVSLKHAGISLLLGPSEAALDEHLGFLCSDCRSGATALQPNLASLFTPYNLNAKDLCRPGKKPYVNLCYFFYTALRHKSQRSEKPLSEVRRRGWLPARLVEGLQAGDKL